MGLEMGTISIKAGPETLVQLEDLQRALHPLMENRSQVVRFTVAYLHSMLFMTDRLHGMITKLQRLQCGISEYQISLEFPLEK